MGAAGAGYLVDLESDQQINPNKKADPSGPLDDRLLLYHNL